MSSSSSSPSSFASWRKHVAADGSVRVLNPRTREWELITQPGDTKAAPLLFIEGRCFDFDFAGGGFRIAGLPIVIGEQQNRRKCDAQEDADTGDIVWDGACVLATMLEHSETLRPLIVGGGTVLELGAGTGLAGLSALALGATKVYLTDLPYCHDALERNKARTVESWGKEKSDIGSSVVVTELDWNKELPDILAGVSLVIASDVVWLMHLVQPLVETMERLDRKFQSDTGGALPFVFAHQTRSIAADKAFFSALSKAGFQVRELDTPSRALRSNKIRVLRIERENSASSTSH